MLIAGALSLQLKVLTYPSGLLGLGSTRNSAVMLRESLFLKESRRCLLIRFVKSICHARTWCMDVSIGLRSRSRARELSLLTDIVHPCVSGGSDQRKNPYRT